MFKSGYGANEIYHDRVVHDTCGEYIRWPDEDECKEIAQCIEKLLHFPNCVGLMDGTLLMLTFAPTSDDAADYHGRKFPCSFTLLVINDEKRMI